jgi:hypothetical protein
MCAGPPPSRPALAGEDDGGGMGASQLTGFIEKRYPFFTIGHALSLKGRAASSAGTVARTFS